MELRAPAQAQARIEELAEKCAEGKLKPGNILVSDASRTANREGETPSDPGIIGPEKSGFEGLSPSRFKPS